MEPSAGTIRVTEIELTSQVINTCKLANIGECQFTRVDAFVHGDARMVAQFQSSWPEPQSTA